MLILNASSLLESGDASQYLPIHPKLTNVRNSQETSCIQTLFSSHTQLLSFYLQINRRPPFLHNQGSDRKVSRFPHLPILNPTSDSHGYPGNEHVHLVEEMLSFCGCFLSFLDSGEYHNEFKGSESSLLA